MAKQTVIRVGSKEYRIDMNRLLNTELMAIERETSFSAVEWQMKMNVQSMIAVTALIWLVRKRYDDPQLQFSDVEFNTADVEVIWQDDKEDDEEAGKDSESDTEVNNSTELTTSTQSSS